MERIFTLITVGVIIGLFVITVRAATGIDANKEECSKAGGDYILTGPSIGVCFAKGVVIK